MKIRELVSDVGTGMIGGYVGTKVMEPVSMKLYELESEETRRKEDEARPGPPYLIAARKTTERLGIELSEEQLQKVATYVFHYGLGMSWGPPYAFLRRWTALNPVSAGLLTGAVMSLLVDEGMTPLLGFSAPNRAYPLATHLRGFAAHLAFGLGVSRYRRSDLLAGRQPSQRKMMPMTHKGGSRIETPICPACGCSLVRLGISKDRASAYRYGGDEHLFCCEGCVDVFKMAPEEYLREVSGVVVCPVCLAEKRVEATVELEHEGEILNFCRCPHCRQEFVKNPERFVARLAG